MKHLNLISYFGGKWPHLAWLTSKFPKGNFHFVDLMCGSANVALNVDYPLITINDLNDEVVNLFHVLRDKPDEITKAVYYTPFSRAELRNIVNDTGPVPDPVERARRYYVRSQLGYGANGSQNNHHGFGCEYGIQKGNYYRVDNWNEKLKKLPEIIQKLRQMQIESRDAFELFEKVDRPTSIIYIDPPYVLDTRKSKKRYKHEWSDEMHMHLAAMLTKSKAFVAVSGYESDLYNELFSDFFKIKSPVNASTVSKKPANEYLWTNYDTAQLNGVLTLDL